MTKSEYDGAGMSLEANRRKTFKDWPYDDVECNCTSAKMAAAGFYHVPQINEPDLVRCYVCLKELDGWEPDDEPWQEHKKHSSSCPLLKMTKKQEDWTIEEYLKINLKSQEIKIRKMSDDVMEEFKMEAVAVRGELENLLEE